MILVTTAGKVGTEAVRSLIRREAPVRVLVRDPGKATALADAGAEGAVARLAVPAQELNVIASAARAGVGHVVKASSKASADSPIARRRGQAEIEVGLAGPGTGP